MMINKLILLSLFIPSLLFSQNFWMSSDTLFIIDPDSMNTSGGFDVNSSGVITDDNDILCAFVFDQSFSINQIWKISATSPFVVFKGATDAGGATINTADIADVSVTQTEFAELEAIGATTISANQ